MAEATNQNSTDNGQAGNTEENKTNTQKTFTQEEVNNLVQKRISEVQAKADERNKNAIAEALAEYDRKAKMTEEERLNEERKARDHELAEKEKSITLRENRADGIEKLAELNIDTKLVDFIVDVDKDKMQKNIETFSKVFNEAVSKAVEAKLAGKTPTDYGDGSKTTNFKKSDNIQGYKRPGMTAF